MGIYPCSLSQYTFVPSYEAYGTTGAAIGGGFFVAPGFVI